MLRIVYNRSISACRRYAGWEDACSQSHLKHPGRKTSRKCLWVWRAARAVQAVQQSLRIISDPRRRSGSSMDSGLSRCSATLSAPCGIAAAFGFRFPVRLALQVPESRQAFSSGGCSSAMSVCDAASQWQRATALLETTKATLGPRS